MILGLAGVAIGAMLALVRGGRPRHVASWWVRWPTALVAAAGVLVLARLGLAGTSGVLVAGALGLMVVALLANLHLPGVGVVAIGLLANLAPILLVGATPVHARALEAVGASPDLLLPTQVVADDATPAMLLASRIPVPLTSDVVSFGDLVVMVGLAAVARSLMLPSRRRIPVREVLEDGPLTLGDADGAWPVVTTATSGLAARRTQPPMVDLTTDRVARLGEHPVEVDVGQPVPVPLGWERDDDGVAPPWRASLRPRRSRTHPTMRLSHHR